MQIQPSKLFSLDAACELRESFRKQGKVVVFTNGCFDMLHVGHVFSLQQAAELGDRLFVAINSDDSVKALKGATRPLMDETERAYMLSALECVSGVFIFNSKRLTNEILRFKPDIYVKSGDYTLDTLDPEERAALESVGAGIKFLKFLNGFSTTSLIEKIKFN